MTNDNTKNVVVSSRVRLARTAAKIPFPQKGITVEEVAYLVKCADQAADF